MTEPRPAESLGCFPFSFLVVAGLLVCAVVGAGKRVAQAIDHGAQRPCVCADSSAASRR